MNSAKSLFSHQLGLSRWTRYDEVLTRLVCDKANEFDSIFQTGPSDTPIFACKFSQSEGSKNLLALANESGSVVVVDTSNPRYPRYGGHPHNNAIFDIAWLPNTLKLVTASGDHSAVLIDMANGDFQVEHLFVGHTRSLKTVACCEDNSNIFATGGRDGKINVWDVRVDSACSRMSTTSAILIPYSHLQQSQLKHSRRKYIHVSAANSVTGLIFQDFNTLVSCGSGDGVIKVWDLRKTYYAKNRSPYAKHLLSYAGNTLRNGFSHLMIDYHRNILYASCLDSVIYAYNINTFNPTPIRQYYGHQNRTFYVKMCLGGDGEYIMSGSSDSNAYIWHRNKSTPIVRLVGHDQEVTGVGWNLHNNELLVTCSDDFIHKFWSVSKDDLTHKENVRERTGYAEALPTFVEAGVNTCLSDIEILSKSQNEIICQCYEFKDHQCMFCLGNKSNGTPEPKPTNSKCTVSKEKNSKKRPLEAIDLNLPSTSKTFIDASPAEKKPRLDVIAMMLSDLPNFIVDGKAPHLSASPVKSPEKDWLTKLRLERKIPDIRQLSSPTSPGADKTPTKTLTNKTSESPLLRYFKITNSPTTSRAKLSNVSLSTD